MPVETALQISLRRLNPDDWPLVEAMYESFVPFGAAMGLPPRDAAARKAWLAVIRAGINLVAFADGRLAGHLALLAIDDAVELMCFVHQDFRRRGIATMLTRMAVDAAREAGYGRISVFLDTHNVGARYGLFKFGFRPVWEDLEEAEYAYFLRGREA